MPMNVPTASTRFRLASAALGVTLPPLLRRMDRDFAHKQGLERSTATLMWGAYALGSLAYIDALRLGTKPRADAVGVAALYGGVAGAGLLAGAMREFESPGHVTGTRTGGLVTSGVYRYSRNPQYVGIVLAAGAGAAATRSVPAALLTAGLASAYRFWVPLEEAALRRCFGEEYGRYAAATSRWLRPGRSAAISD